jgi:hypothetical protein
MLGLVATVVIQGGIPSDPAVSLKQFLNREAKVTTDLLKVSITDAAQTQAPTVHLVLMTSPSKIRVETNGSYGVWNGKSGLVVDRSHQQQTYVKCSTEREVLASFGLDDALLGPTLKGEWQAGSWTDAADGPKAFMCSFGWKANGDQNMIAWTLDKPGGELEAVQIVQPQREVLKETAFAFNHVNKLVASAEMFSVLPSTGAVAAAGR